MKKQKSIIIKNPYLLNLRNNLRNILIKADIQKRKKLRKQGKHSEIEKLREIAERSIIYCPVCHKVNNNMTFNTKMKRWYCIDCYKDLPKYLKPDWNPVYPEAIKKKIGGYLQLLAESSAGRCRTNYYWSEKILTMFRIPREDQIAFFNICKEYGGNCDCEIIMNALESILYDLNHDIERFRELIGYYK